MRAQSKTSGSGLLTSRLPSARSCDQRGHRRRLHHYSSLSSLPGASEQLDGPVGCLSKN